MKPTELKPRLQQAYDRDAARRDKAPRQDFKATEREIFLKFVQTARVETLHATSLLEIGAGPGYDSLFFQQQGFDVIATDLSPEHVRLCQEKGLTAYVRDFYELGFPAESFDAVWAMNCLLHVPSAELPGVLSDIRDVLKPGGLFYYGVWGGVDEEEGIYEDDVLDPPRWFTRLLDEDLKKLAEQMFEILYFNTNDDNSDGPGHHQSMILRKGN